MQALLMRLLKKSWHHFQICLGMKATKTVSLKRCPNKLPSNFMMRRCNLPLCYQSKLAICILHLSMQHLPPLFIANIVNWRERGLYCSPMAAAWQPQCSL
uniref:Uncharacterized protein MANES_01G069000 n=1 Tax=Rhizophora mucronata TaxID=61149 RepID=A0A2P2LM83_RHIMU